MDNKELHQYVLGIADNSMILGQRLGELCGHGPNLETDIALTNISLDLFGQTRSYFSYAASLLDTPATEDDLAFLRTERQYKNVLLVEQPNTHFGYVILRQFLFDSFHVLFLTELSKSKDQTLAAIAKKGIKESRYHVRFSGDWVKRLGDGTPESHQKITEALNDLWPYTKELFKMTPTEQAAAQAGVGVDLNSLEEAYMEHVSQVLNEATLALPETKFFQFGGKEGKHTEHMGYLLADLQYMQRTYPNMTW